jgi:hypothetical protein
MRYAPVRIATAFIRGILSADPALAREPMSDAQVRQAIIQDSIAHYLSRRRTGGPSRCGG